jgi:hypothetical protein
VARLLQIDVKYPQNCSVRSRKYVNGIFSLKNAIFTTANVLGNRSTSTALLIIWSHPDLSIVSRLRSEGINLKSHRLNPISPKIAHSMFVFLSNVYYFYSSVVFPILRPFPCSGRRKPVFESQLAYSCRRYPHSSRVSFLPPKKQPLKN